MSSADWWANKLGQNREAPAPVLPARPVQPAFPVAQPNPYQQPTQPQQQNYPPTEPSSTKTTYQRDTGYCPGCGSGNYMKPPGRSDSGYRCFDCGYPIVQSGTGVPNDPSVKTSHARVQSGGEYRPDIIIARIDDTGVHQ